MRGRILVDSSVVVEAQRGNSLLIRGLIDNREEVVISRVTSYELIYGSRDKSELRKNESLLANIIVVEINEEISRFAYDLLGKYTLNLKLNLPDALISATSYVYSYPLWTLNKKHFAHIKEIELFSN
ncbi:TPA: VapC toxin family PIN domain ribonuclease [candidate division WWE3 bacterium]|uniref:VapC toxin family PIN domain ribonuclease n=4 Tax=Katanobacteria TaxID=422282 RepID=A0A351JSX1_UNCKA|nr:MAG: putative ribonuclease VapC [candidate division WWE3 bacterium GW2011_GWA2_44_16]KKT69698.1 MAG: putative ribonuclease VapC [candidate division WWE3 bacterium GW2011_GWB1_44_4]KKT85218.1 MAG: putative ribonuclease VapC [candidate division WWE3 bacterium GW2011_GWC2_44_9]HAZ29391.1 VapC toxin family PIN domain ribonuclease [candidate division WWE3 bacterium]